jgi:hypothetical protein
MISNPYKMSIAVANTLLALLLLTSCGGSGNGDTETPIVATEVINKITVPIAPDPAKNIATIAGVDINKNGVRDDVERAIAKTAVDATSLNRYTDSMSAAQLYQEFITSPDMNAAKARSILDKINCLNADEMRQVLDTEERQILYTKLVIKHNITWSISSGDGDCK